MKRHNRSIASASMDFPAGERRSFQIRFPRRPQSVIFFPAPYPAAVANLGVLTIWERLNAGTDFSCDRAVWDPRSGAPLKGLQSGISLSAFPLIFVSSSFELDLAGVIDALMSCGIEPEAKKRGESEPLIVAGGISLTLNPKPWAPVIDLAILGEGEESVLEWLDIYRTWSAGRGSKAELLRESTCLPHVWIPGRSLKQVRKAAYNQYRQDPASSPAVHPAGHFGDCFLVEINRGCPRKCLFCSVCTAFPARFADVTAVVEKIEHGTQTLGVRKVGLVGAAAGDHPKLKEIVKSVVESGKEVTVSSLRIERTDEELLDLLVSGGMRTLTVAPEAGGEELRNRIGKASTDDDLARLVQTAGRAGLRRLRFYFIIGLPDPEPPEAIIDLMKRLRQEAPTNLRLDVSVASFIPKPGTPWEKAAFASTSELNATKRNLRSGLSAMRGVSIRTESTRSERLAALLSRGDEALGEALICSRQKGRPLEQELRRVGRDPEMLLNPAP